MDLSHLDNDITSRYDLAEDLSAIRGSGWRASSGKVRVLPTGYDDRGAPLLLTGVFVMVGFERVDQSGEAGNLWGRTFLSTMVTENGHDRPLVPGTTLRLIFQDGD